MGNQNEMTMICKDEGGGYKVWALIAGNTFIVLTIAVIAGFSLIFSRKLQYFLIKERAPILALAQSVIFLLTILVPYIVEILGYTGLDITKHDIPRRIAKALYISSRQTAYMVFVLRLATSYQSSRCILQLENNQER